MAASRVLGTALLVAAGALAAPATAHDLPLGDGKVSTSPRAGYIFSCQTQFPSNAPGAQRSGAWLDAAAGNWDPDLKPIIDGSVTWPSEISIGIEDNKRVVRGNNLPSHTTGTFPVSRSDDAYEYDRNPNSIRAQDVLLRLPVEPKVAASATCLPMGMIGFTLTGAALFNALDAGGRDAPAHEIQDACNGHPERQGQYHYHDYSGCMTDTRSGPGGHSELVGYALDGFGIYGLYEASGVMVHDDDLDACHGHVGNIVWDGKVVSLYHYHFTEEYPYSLGCFTGDVTLKRR